MPGRCLVIQPPPRKLDPRLVSQTTPQSLPGNFNYPHRTVSVFGSVGVQQNIGSWGLGMIGGIAGPGTQRFKSIRGCCRWRAVSLVRPLRDICSRVDGICQQWWGIPARHGGTPIAGWFTRENPNPKCNDLGVPSFMQTPKWGHQHTANIVDWIKQQEKSFWTQEKGDNVCGFNLPQSKHQCQIGTRMLRYDLSRLVQFGGVLKSGASKSYGWFLLSKWNATGHPYDLKRNRSRIVGCMYISKKRPMHVFWCFLLFYIH